MFPEGRARLLAAPILIRFLPIGKIFARRRPRIDDPCASHLREGNEGVDLSSGAAQNMLHRDAPDGQGVRNEGTMAPRKDCLRT